MASMYRIVPSPTQGMWLTDENGVVISSGTNIHDLRLNMLMAMERRELYPFMYILDEYGKRVMLKDYVRN
jgi:hypothetical protein